jgi:protein gp37
MNKTRIEWADYTWNPIKGLCPVGCWYCYARKIYHRFGVDPELRLDYAELLGDIVKLNGHPRVFACSTMELFDPRIPEIWRKEIFNVIWSLRAITFVILTKLPQNITYALPPNVWLGVSVTGRNDFDRIVELKGKEAGKKFVSFEPLLEPDFKPSPNGLLIGLDWIIVGRLTGHGKRLDPSVRSLNLLLSAARQFNIPIFLKNNLRNIWSGNLIQEIPKGEEHGSRTV